MTSYSIALTLAAVLAMVTGVSIAAERTVGQSPWGPDDEINRLNLSTEAFPSALETDYVPVHTYLLAEQGTPIMELVYLEELSRDRLYEFAFLGGALQLRGADAAPIRPVALPLR